MPKIQVGNNFLEYHIQDALKGLPKLKAQYIDLIVTSPPYDDLREYGGYHFDFVVTCKELYRVLKNGGVLVWIVGDQTKNGSETGTSFKQALGFIREGFYLHDTMSYEKAAIAAPSSNRYYQVFEYMFIFSKGKPKTFNPIKDRRNVWMDGRWGKNTRRDVDGVLKEGKKPPKPKKFGMRTNIWRYKVGMGNTTKDKIAYEHPALFPDELAKDHILSWSNENDIVLDPFLGSGTTLKMCRLLNRSGIGFEINPDYEHIIRERLMFDNKTIDGEW